MISGIAFPDNDLRKVLLGICESLMARCIETEQTIMIFGHLPSCIMNLLSNSSSAEVSFIFKIQGIDLPVAVTRIFQCYVT